MIPFRSKKERKKKLSLYHSSGYASNRMNVKNSNISTSTIQHTQTNTAPCIPCRVSFPLRFDWVYSTAAEQLFYIRAGLATTIFIYCLLISRRHRRLILLYIFEFLSCCFFLEPFLCVSFLFSFRAHIYCVCLLRRRRLRRRLSIGVHVCVWVCCCSTCCCCRFNEMYSVDLASCCCYFPVLFL